uniref:Uncharacterized protein n=1 Tax=Meloidogyne enterolobii TaxID=390850 RepID=A0A6V7UMU7_MELEN|nr:unnamed protein product [Meloidogyne enterolobii]
MMAPPRRSTGGIPDNRPRLPPRNSVSGMHLAMSSDDLVDLTNRHRQHIDNYSHQDGNSFYGQRFGGNIGGAGHNLQYDQRFGGYIGGAEPSGQGNTASDVEAYRHSYSFGNDFRDVHVDHNSEHNHNGDQDRRSFQGFPPY